MNQGKKECKCVHVLAAEFKHAKKAKGLEEFIGADKSYVKMQLNAASSKGDSFLTNKERETS